MITSKMRIADVVGSYPKAIKILNEYHIDYCCGGKESLEKALKDLGIEEEKFLEELNKRIAETADEAEDSKLLDIDKLMQMDVPTLIDYVVETHHAKERILLTEIDELVNKILFVHYEHRQEQLVPLHSNFSDLRKELQEHFAKEEKVIFPQMKKSYLEKSNYVSVKDLEDEHEAAGAIIKEIETITNNYTPPKGSCRSYRLAFEKLQELVEDIYIHIYTENSLLFEKYEGGIAL